jgi:aspartate/methionine/tyrosine aminotransferase
VGQDDAYSWLTFTGKADPQRAVADQVEERSGVTLDPEAQVVITCAEGDAMVDALFVLADRGDEAILTDPTYAGMISRGDPPLRGIGGSPGLKRAVHPWRSPI